MRVYYVKKYAKKLVLIFFLLMALYGIFHSLGRGG